MARKQAVKEAKQPTLKELRTRRTFLQESLAVKQLEATTKLIESFGFYDDFPSDDLWERTRGRRFQAFPPSQPSDRKGGANWPLWRTEAELDFHRQRSRVLSKVNGYAVCLLRNLTNYVIGDGFKYKTQAKKSIDTSPEPGQQLSSDIEKTVATVQAWVDQHNERNRWNCAGNPLETQPTATTREKESFRRVLRDGEAFIRLFHQDDGSTCIRFIEPELIRNPVGKGASPTGWTFGIQHHVDPDTGIEDVERIVAYNVRYPDGTEEVVLAAEVIHIRPDDEDCTIKRGTPAFSYDTANALERASKLQRNTSTAAAIRAATAEIWEHEYGTPAQLTSLASGLASAQVQNPTTGRLENIEDIRPGTIRRVPMGQKKVPLDSSAGVTEHLSAVQGDLRQAGAAFAAPEYITGDASNANYASTKEAGTPFVLNGESTQAHFKSAFLTVLWRCIKHAADCGRLPANALRVVELQVEAPAIKQRDPLQKAQEDQILSPLGKSNQTILMENGLDPEVEANNKQEWEDRFGAPGMGLNMPPDMPPIPGMESKETPVQWLARLLREAKDASGHEHAADGKFGSGGTKKGKETGDKKPSSDTDTHAKAAEVLKDKGLLRRISSLPKAIGVKAKNFAQNLYAKAEAKYGPRWAKAIVGTAIITLPTPFTMGSVAAMTGLAHVWTKYVSKTQKPAAAMESQEQELTPDQIEALAQEMIDALLAAFPDETPIKESVDASGHDEDERISLIADIMHHAFGEKAVAFFDDGHLTESWDSASHPRGKNGRFIPKGSAEAVATAKASIAKVLKGKRTPDTHKELAEHLNLLTVKQLGELKKEHQISASGRSRADLVAKLTDRLAKGRMSDDQENRNSLSTGVDKPPQSSTIVDSGDKPKMQGEGGKVTSETTTRRSANRDVNAYRVGNVIQHNGEWKTIVAYNRNRDDQGSYEHRLTLRPATEEESRRGKISQLEREIQAMGAGPDDARNRQRHDADLRAKQNELRKLQGRPSVEEELAKERKQQEETEAAMKAGSLPERVASHLGDYTRSQKISISQASKTIGIPEKRLLSLVYQADDDAPPTAEEVAKIEAVLGAKI